MSAEARNTTGLSIRVTLPIHEKLNELALEQDQPAGAVAAEILAKGLGLKAAPRGRRTAAVALAKLEQLADQVEWFTTADAQTALESNLSRSRRYLRLAIDREILVEARDPAGGSNNAKRYRRRGWWDET